MTNADAESPTQSNYRLKIDVFSPTRRRDATADDAALQISARLYPAAGPDDAVFQLCSVFNHGSGTDDIDATQYGSGFDLRRWINRRAIHPVQS